MDVIQAIYSRRSIRKFEDRPVECEKLLELCRLGAAGPTACNQRPWSFVAVNEKEAMRSVTSATMFGKFGAPAAIVMCADMRRTNITGRAFWAQDCSAGMENILLGALEMGLGTVWVGVWPIRPAAWAMARALHLPRHVRPLGVAYIGYPAETKEPRTQFEDGMVHWQRWDKN